MAKGMGRYFGGGGPKFLKLFWGLGGKRGLTGAQKYLGEKVAGKEVPTGILGTGNYGNGYIFRE